MAVGILGTELEFRFDSLDVEEIEPRLEFVAGGPCAVYEMAVGPDGSIEMLQVGGCVDGPCASN
jgi:hypothetical protein